MSAIYKKYLLHSLFVTLLFFAVSSCGGGGSSTPDEQFPGSPGAVSGITAVAGDTQNTISWEATDGASLYTLYWDTEAAARSVARAGNCTGDSFAGITDTTFTHTGLSNGAGYNYNVTATDADGDEGECAGSVAAGTPTVATVPGCTDSKATNYDPNANENDGSCKYPAAPTPTPTPTPTGGGGGSSGGGNGCFIAGTKVLLSDGSKKNIEEIQIGDILLGLENSKNKVLGLVRPTLGGRKLFGFNGGKAFVTSGHPFMTSEGAWKSIDPNATLREKAGMVVDKLEVGNSLVTKDGEIKIRSIDGRDSDPEQTLYDFELDGNNTYYADSYAVHNKGGDAGGYKLLERKGVRSSGLTFSRRHGFLAISLTCRRNTSL